MSLHETSYEITLRHRDGATFLVGYTPRKSKRGLLDAMMNVHVVEQLIEKVDMGETDHFEFGKVHGLWTATCKDWKAGFTSRTHRDIEHGGETAHPFLGA